MIAGRIRPTSLAVLVLLLAALTWPVAMSGPARAQETLRIAAVVNDDVISVHDLANRVALLLATTGQALSVENQRRAAPHVIRMLIDEKLKMQEARRLNIQVTREEIDRTLTRIAGQIGVPPDQLPALLQSAGIDIATLIEQVESELAWVKAVGRRVQGRISEDDVDARIARMRETAGQPEYRLAEIVLPVDDSTTAEDMVALARRIMTQLREGVNFQALARNYSAAASAAVGGDLGWLRPDEMDPDTRRAIQDLEPGQVLGPLTTLSGYQIILMIDRRIAAGVGDGSDGIMVQEVAIAVPLGSAGDGPAGALERARDLAQGVTSCESLAERAAADDTAEMRGPTLVETSQLQGVRRDRLRGLSPGQTAEPFVDGDTVVLLMVCARDAAAVSTQIREQVREMIFNERLEATARRMIRDLRRDAFVDIRI